MPPEELRSLVQAARRIVADLGALLVSMEALAAEHDQVSARCGRLEEQHREMRADEARLRQERDELAQSLAALRASHEALQRQLDVRRQPGQGHRVMVVDDAPSELRAIESILRSAGHDVLAYGGGEDLEDKVAAERPDVLLLDIVMPNRNGYEILRALRKDDRTKHTPVVMVTARSEESDRVWSRRQGADDYVSKPFTAEQLLAVVQRLAG